MNENNLRLCISVALSTQGFQNASHGHESTEKQVKGYLLFTKGEAAGQRHLHGLHNIADWSQVSDLGVEPKSSNSQSIPEFLTSRHVYGNYSHTGESLTLALCKL